jgi:hypothetical protein
MTTDEVLAILDGERSTLIVMSTGPNMLIQFSSGVNITGGRGFNISYWTGKFYSLTIGLC